MLLSGCGKFIRRAVIELRRARTLMGRNGLRFSLNGKGAVEANDVDK
jgi:hypothetical protein